MAKTGAETIRVGVSLLAARPHFEGGLGTYVRAVARALARRSSEQYVFFSPASMIDLWKEVLTDNAEIVSCPVDSRLREFRAAYEALILPIRARRARCGVIYYPHLVVPLAQKPSPVVTLHDVMSLTQPAEFPWHKRIYMRLVYRRLASGATPIVTASEFCRRQFVALLNIPKNRVTVVPSGVDDAFLKEPTSQASSTPLPQGPYLLSVAAAHRHKRLPLLVRMFDLIARDYPTLGLVLAGIGQGQGPERRALSAAVAASPFRDRISTLKRVAWEDLPALYLGASVFVHSSAFEGFGLPIAEAMFSSVPVVASPSEAVIEVLGGHGTIARGWQEGDLADAVRSVLRWSPEQRRTRASEASAYARDHYNWEHAAALLARTFTMIGGADGSLPRRG